MAESALLTSRFWRCGCLSAVLFLAAVPGRAQTTPPQNQGRFLVQKTVAEVELNIAVVDRKGHYVTGLRPSDFVISEDGIPETITSFEEGNQPTLTPSAASTAAVNRVPTPGESIPVPLPLPAVTAAPGGASVFILMDTSNYMFEARGFVYAQNAIIDFVNSLNPADRVAFYSYSRNLARETRATMDRAAVVRGVRRTVNGDAAALYDSLLLTLRDAAHVPGRKVVVVFSNGPDSASMVPPEYVGELAQSEGVPVYIVSTRHAESDPATAAAMRRLSADTGGETFFARRWQDERTAFQAIGDDLAHLYFLTYNPRPNPNHGWRSIKVTLAGLDHQHHRIRTRSGYQPLRNAAVER